MFYLSARLYGPCKLHVEYSYTISAQKEFLQHSSRNKYNPEIYFKPVGFPFYHADWGRFSVFRSESWILEKPKVLLGNWVRTQGNCERSQRQEWVKVKHQFNNQKSCTWDHETGLNLFSHNLKLLEIEDRNCDVCGVKAVDMT